MFLIEKWYRFMELIALIQITYHFLKMYLFMQIISASSYDALELKDCPQFLLV